MPSYCNHGKAVGRIVATGPDLASAGPDWWHFCGAPLSGVCRNLRRV